MPADPDPTPPAPRRTPNGSGRVIGFTDPPGIITSTRYDLDGRQLGPDEPPDPGDGPPTPDTPPDDPHIVE